MNLNDLDATFEGDNLSDLAELETIKNAGNTVLSHDNKELTAYLNNKKNELPCLTLTASGNDYIMVEEDNFNIYLPDNSHSKICNLKDDMVSVKIIIAANLILNYVFASVNTDIDESVHQIVDLVSQNKIVCYILDDELNRSFDNIPNSVVSKYLEEILDEYPIVDDLSIFINNSIFDEELEEIVDEELEEIFGKDAIERINVERRQKAASKVDRTDARIKKGRSQVLSNIKERIQRDFEIVKVGKDMKNYAYTRELLDNDLAIEITYAEENQLAAVVTSNSKFQSDRDTHTRVQNPANFIDWYRENFGDFSLKNQVDADDRTNGLNPNIHIQNLEGHIDWYRQDFSDSSPEIQSYSELFNNIDTLNQLAGFQPKQDNVPLYNIGHGLYLTKLEVYSTNRRVVSATIKLEDRNNAQEHTFVGMGNGIISALLSAIDTAVIYLVDNQIIKKALPTSKNIDLFHVIDLDRDVNAKVICKIMFLHQDRYYPGQGEHTDTVKSVALAYANALKAVLADRVCPANFFLLEGEAIEWQYKTKKRRNFSNLQRTELRLIDYDLTKANFSGSNLRDSIVGGCNLIGSTWDGVDFTGSTLIENNFTGSFLSNATFNGAIVRGCVFVKSVLQGAVLIAAILVNNNFTHANFRDADLSHANLSKSILISATLINANLTGANLSNANLSNADLTGANLTHANLTGAILENTNFAGAILANVIGAVIETNVVVSQPTTDSKITPNSANGYFYQT